jgi:hypothetical protein
LGCLFLAFCPHLSYTCSINDGRERQDPHSAPDHYSVSDHFAGRKPLVLETYQRLLTELRKFGPVGEEPKKTSIHLVNRSAFAGLVTHKTAMMLNIKSSAQIDKRSVMDLPELRPGP